MGKGLIGSYAMLACKNNAWVVVDEPLAVKFDDESKYLQHTNHIEVKDSGKIDIRLRILSVKQKQKE